MPNCAVSDSTRLGDNVVVSVGVVVNNKQVPDNILFFGSVGDSKELIYHPLKESRYIDYYIST